MRFNYLIVFICFFSWSFIATAQSISQLVIDADSLDLVENKYNDAIDLRNNLLSQLDSTQDLYAKLKLKQNYSQGSLFFSKGETDKARLCFKKIIDHKEVFSKTEVDINFVYESYAQYYVTTAFSFGWDEALKIALEAKDYIGQFSNDFDHFIDMYYDLGYIHKQLRRYKTATFYYQKSLLLQLEHQTEDDSGLALIYNNLAAAYSDQHRFKESLKYYQKGLQATYLANDTDKSRFVLQTNHVINEFIDYGDQLNAKVFVDSLSSNLDLWLSSDGLGEKNLLDVFGKDKKTYTAMYGNLALLNYAVSVKDTISANQYYSTIIDLKGQLINNNCETLLPYFLTTLKYQLVQTQSDKIDKLVTNLEEADDLGCTYYKNLFSRILAKSYYETKQYDLAESMLSVVDAAEINYFDKNEFDKTIIRARITQDKGDINSAKKIYNKAFQHLISKQDTVLDLSTLKASDLRIITSSYFVNSLLYAASGYEDLSRITKDKNDLKVSSNLYWLIGKLFENLYGKGRFNKDLDYYNRKVSDGLMKYSDHYDTDQLLNTLENNTSQFILKAFETNRIKDDFLIPEFMLEEYHIIKLQLEHYEDEVLSSIDLKDKSLLENRSKVLMDSIHKLHPNYFKFHNPSVFDSKTFRKNLKEGEVLLRYFNGDKNVYLFQITRNNVKYSTISKQIPFKNRVNEYRSSLISKSKESAVISQDLFEMLLGKVDKKFKNIIIVGSGLLNYIPFESLRTSDGSFLIEDHTLSYATSLQLYDIQSENAQSTRLVSAAFAPNYDNKDYSNLEKDIQEKVRSGWYPLPGAQKESKAVSEIVEADLFLDEEASKDKFIKLSESYNLFHLAMHAYVDNENPEKSGILFSNNQSLLFSELKNLRIPADLVTLSACNTGYGKIEDGEGVMSMSRAFTYAGVSSIVMSLWEVPDQQTNFIMTSFYKHLKSGKSKSVALRTAKLDYLKEIDNESLKHPYYWSGFVLSGDTSAITSPTRIPIYFAIAACFIFFLILFMFWIRKKHKHLD